MFHWIKTRHCRSFKSFFFRDGIRDLYVNRFQCSSERAYNARAGNIERDWMSQRGGIYEEGFMSCGSCVLQGAKSNFGTMNSLAHGRTRSHLPTTFAFLMGVCVYACRRRKKNKRSTRDVSAIERCLCPRDDSGERGVNFESINVTSRPL